MGKATWTAQQDAELERLWPTNSAGEIGRALGKTRNAIIGRFHRLQGDYADYVDPTRHALRIERQRLREIMRRKEARAIQRMKDCIESGVSRDAAIRQARDDARLKTIGEVFGITGERVRQIAEASA